MRGADGKQFGWVQDLLEILDNSAPDEFLENTKLELYQDQVFCFTPKGQLIQLPRGATPVDFAYAVHSQVGDTTVGAKVNGRLMPLRTELAERRPGGDHDGARRHALAGVGALGRHRQGARAHPALRGAAAARAAPATRAARAGQGVPPGRAGRVRKGAGSGAEVAEDARALDDLYVAVGSGHHRAEGRGPRRLSGVAEARARRG